MPPNHSTAGLSLLEKRWPPRLPLWLWTIIKSCVSFGLLGWLALHFDWAPALGALRAVPWYVAGAGLLLMAQGQLLVAYRLQSLLAAQDIRVGYKYSLRLTFVGLFAGNFLPSTVGGDAVKVVVLAKAGYGKAASTASVVLDRLINLAAVVLLLPSVVTLELLSAEATTVLSVAMIGLSICGGLLVALYARCKRTTAASDSDTQSTVLSRLRGIASRWLRQPGLLALAMCLSWASILSSVAAVWLVAWSLNVPAGFVEVLAAMVLVYFVSLLPISLNGLGVQEVSLVYLLSHIGATPGHAIVIAVLTRVFYLGVSALGAFDFLAWRRLE